MQRIILKTCLNKYKHLFTLKFMKKIFIACFSLWLINCDIQTDKNYESVGYKPIYLQENESAFAQKSPQKLVNPGKIYLKDNFLIINEKEKGIHLFDNTNPKNPINIGFLEILGNMDIAIKGSTLYADSGENLLCFDVSDFKNIKLVSTVSNMFMGYSKYPNRSNVRFECVDETKGKVVGWQTTDAKNLKCYRNQ